MAQRQHARTGVRGQHSEDEREHGECQLLPPACAHDESVRKDGGLTQRVAAHRLPCERQLPVGRLLLLAVDVRPARAAVRVQQCARVLLIGALGRAAHVRGLGAAGGAAVSEVREHGQLSDSAH
jgi:hypothetical protein